MLLFIGACCCLALSLLKIARRTFLLGIVVSAVIGALGNDRSIYAQSQSVSPEQSYQPYRLIVKIAERSSYIERWRKAGRTGDIEEFRALLGNHTTRAWIDDGLLQGAERFFRQRSEQSILPEEQALLRSLERLCVVELHHDYPNGDSDEVLMQLAAKLARKRGVEYAEPIPLQRTAADVPNDPLVSLQTHLRQIRAFEAWAELARVKQDSVPVVVAIVDTGIDYNHEDLATAIFANAGETGRDAQGRDKRSNGIDDDGNGKIDDWRGWDFVGTNGAREDNDPRPGNDHGTHVAGLVGAVINNRIGIAGATPFVRLMPVKIGTDVATDPFVQNGFQAMLYAAITGARVINCSWRETRESRAAREITDAVLATGALVVSVAGNSNTYQPVYPGAYSGVLSVAALTTDDVRWGQSNYHESVALAAPGAALYSTVLNNGYAFKSGTSMAAPVVSAVAAMIWMRSPELRREQVIARLQATADRVDSLNTDFVGLLGTGRVNALRALTAHDARWLSLVRSSVVTEGADSADAVVVGGRRTNVSITVKNLLAPVRNLRVEVEMLPLAANLSAINSLRGFVPSITLHTSSLGSLETMQERTIAPVASFIFDAATPPNAMFRLMMRFTDDTGSVVGRETVVIMVNPTFRTMAYNTIEATFNSIGNFAFNDFPSNRQGRGFRFNGSDNLLYEGALMIGVSADTVSNTARGRLARQDADFVNITPIVVQKRNDELVGTVEFDDSNRAAGVGVRVRQSLVQSLRRGTEQMFITSYTITNTSNRDIARLFAGLYMDWDIGEDVERNDIVWDDANNLVIAQNLAERNTPVVGMMLLSEQRVNVYAITFDDTTQSGISLADGFSTADKWRALSGGIARPRSTNNDASVVFGAGPIALKRGESAVVSIALLAAPTLDSLYALARTTRERATGGVIVYPNPATERLVVEYESAAQTATTLDFINLLGQRVASVIVQSQQDGRNSVAVNVGTLPSGAYRVRVHSARGVQSATVVIQR
jgi:subtilisin family serine protease